MANITVAYSELGGSPTESRDRSGRFQSTRRYRVAWEDRHSFMEQILGVNGALPVLPFQDPDYSIAYAKSCGAQPEGECITSAAGDPVTYEKAIVTVQFETPSFGYSVSDNEQTLIEEDVAPSAQVLQLANADLYWANDQTEPLNVEESPSKILRFLEWTITFHGLESIPIDTIALMGCVNNAAIESRTLGLTFAAETLLYGGGFPSRVITTRGTQGWKLTHKFTAKPESWNLFPRPGYDTPQAIYKSNGSQFKPFVPASFAGL